MTAYYNEINPLCAEWLQNLSHAKVIAPGVVDSRSITEVRASDLKGFDQCHFFAGVGGWSLACRLAGWPDSLGIWTGSPPCQPFSHAGKNQGLADDRHLWPHYFRLIAACRPTDVVAEQVPAAIGKGWLDGVLADLEGINYSARACVLPASLFGAEHIRQRLWVLAHPNALRTQVPAARQQPAEQVVGGNLYLDWQAANIQRPWADARAVLCHDGTTRRVEPGTPLLANGLPGNLDMACAFGNAIVPQVAAEILKVWLECRP